MFGQSLGGMLTGLGTDPNAAPLFILVALALFSNRAPAVHRAGATGGSVPDSPGVAGRSGPSDPERRTLAPV